MLRCLCHELGQIVTPKICAGIANTKQVAELERTADGPEVAAKETSGGIALVNFRHELAAGAPQIIVSFLRIDAEEGRDPVHRQITPNQAAGICETVWMLV